ncbi:MAG: hypothetical protein UV82_C0014G0010 [Candidatus Magasanikbacteria bacterium GW2011_GWD2_43_18]|nr:MAG: hypothetical protein UV18_C0008G0006 [Candidatus Magasanikbacteria bacterium GW2011_GWC2_42_27]KKT03869.1 MAG: hypothetical protein UV82_C0014G0010 [Candidatus Magasanikbacteria bacterium GW2011_GWD2_43_18]
MVAFTLRYFMHALIFLALFGFVYSSGGCDTTILPDVEIPQEEDSSEPSITFHYGGEGAFASLWANGVWKVTVTLPDGEVAPIWFFHGEYYVSDEEGPTLDEYLASNEIFDFQLLEGAEIEVELMVAPPMNGGVTLELVSHNLMFKFLLRVNDGVETSPKLRFPIYDWTPGSRYTIQVVYDPGWQDGI